jgi:flagellar basal-body rod protein FlgB
MDESIQLLKTIMDGCTTRHRVLANNLANAETPMFKRQDINFKSALEEAINSKDKTELQKASFEIHTDTESPAAANGNNVSTQDELALILQNSLLYNTATTALSSKLSRLRQAIKGS